MFIRDDKPEFDKHIGVGAPGGLSRFQLNSVDRIYKPQLHEIVIDHIQAHPRFYKGLVAAAALAGIAGLIAYGASKPEVDFMSAEDKAIMQEQIRIDKLYDSGVELKHIQRDDGSFLTLPAADYEAAQE